MHYPDESGVRLEETWSALGELADEGTVRAIGLSNYAIEDVERCHAIRAVDVKLDAAALAKLDEIFPGKKTAPENYAW